MYYLHSIGITLLLLLTIATQTSKAQSIIHTPATDVHQILLKPYTIKPLPTPVFQTRWLLVTFNNDQPSTNRFSPISPLSITSNHHSQTKQAALQRFTAAGVEIASNYIYLPMAFVRVNTYQQLQAVLQDPNVIGIKDDMVYHPQLSDALNIIDFTQADSQVAASLGAGTTIAVFDDGASHSTTVKNIAQAVSPGANIVEYDIQDDACGCYDIPSQCTLDCSFDSPDYNTQACQQLGRSCLITRSMDQVLTGVANGENYVAVNISFGALPSSSPLGSCSTNDAEFIAANNNSIAVAVSSGNGGIKNNLYAPACSAHTIAVGATTKADTVWSSSNSSPSLDLLAPGVNLIVPPSTTSSSGTSWASPVVAAAVANLRALGCSMDDSIRILKETGQAITDSANSITRPRIDLGDAVELVVQHGCTASPPLAAPQLSFYEYCDYWTTVNLSWTTISGASRYELYRDNGYNTQKIYDGSATNYSTTHSAISTGFPSFEVRACNQNTCSTYSNVAQTSLECLPW